MEKKEINCLKCEKILHQSVCVVEDAALVTIDFTYMSKYAGIQNKAYLCEDCYANNSHLFVNIIPDLKR